MKTLKEIQKEAYIFLRSNWTTDKKQIDFIDSLITKAYEAGKINQTKRIVGEIEKHYNLGREDLIKIIKTKYDCI